jgi:hypothetical protein
MKSPNTALPVLPIIQTPTCDTGDDPVEKPVPCICAVGPNCRVHSESTLPVSSGHNSMEELKRQQQSSWLATTHSVEKRDPFGFKSATTSVSVTPIPSRAESPLLLGTEQDRAQWRNNQGVSIFSSLQRLRGCERPTTANNKRNGSNPPEELTAGELGASLARIIRREWSYKTNDAFRRKPQLASKNRIFKRTHLPKLLPTKVEGRVYVIPWYSLYS